MSDDDSNFLLSPGTDPTPKTFTKPPDDFGPSDNPIADLKQAVEGFGQAMKGTTGAFLMHPRRFNEMRQESMERAQSDGNPLTTLQVGDFSALGGTPVGTCPDISYDKAIEVPHEMWQELLDKVDGHRDAALELAIEMWRQGDDG